MRPAARFGGPELAIEMVGVFAASLEFPRRLCAGHAADVEDAGTVGGPLRLIGAAARIVPFPVRCAEPMHALGAQSRPEGLCVDIGEKPGAERESLRDLPPSAHATVDDGMTIDAEVAADQRRLHVEVDREPTARREGVLEA